MILILSVFIAIVRDEKNLKTIVSPTLNPISISQHVDRTSALIFLALEALQRKL